MPGKSQHRKTWLLLGTMAATTVCAVLRRFPPDRYSFYPRCPIYTAFRLQCPGCGATRAIAALLHGNLAEALHWNALFIGLLPFLLSYAALYATRDLRSGSFYCPQPPRWVFGSALAIAAVFTLARNMPR